MIRSFDALALRQLRTRRLRVLLTAFGIVLGVGMVFGVLLLVGTIRSTFDDLISSAWGNTDLVVMPHGGGGVMPERTLQDIRATTGVNEAGGMLGVALTRLDSRDKAIKGLDGQMFVAGIDPNAPPYDFRWVAGRNITSGPEVIVERNWANDRHVHLGDRIAVVTPTGRASVHVVGIFRFSSNLSYGGAGFAGMPIAEVRRLTGIASGYNQISVKATDRGQVDALKSQLAAKLGKGVDVRTPAGVSDQIQKQFQGLNVVLYFFSGIALFVGGFLILNSFNMTVLQRMRELGMLRTLGATRGMIIRSVMTEALAIGLVGSVIGLAFGAAMSVGLVALMKGVGMPVGAVQFSAGAAVTAVIVGLLATAAGALWPARRAGRVPPIQAVLGSGAVRRSPSVRRALVGVALFVPGLVFGGKFWFGDQSASGGLAAGAGIAGTMLMFVGITLAAPFVIMPIVRMLARPLRRVAPTGGRLAADATRSNPARTAATAAALTIGLSVIVVNGAMSASFIGTINDQVDTMYARDFTVTPVGTTIETAVGQTMAPGVRRDVAAFPGAGVVTPLRGEMFDFPRGGGSRAGLGMGVDPADYPKVDRTPIRGAGRAEAFAGLAGGGVIVSRVYERAARLSVGSSLVLRGPAGTHRARVSGVLNSMEGGGQQTMLMSLGTMRAVFGPAGATQLLVKAAPGADAAALGRRIDAYLQRSHPNLEAISTAETKSRIRDEVNQQFNLFNAILAIAVVVSLLGVINTLAMSVIERTREIGVLRALGSSRWQVRLTMLDESLLITTAGAIAGIGIGALIAYVWVSGLDSLLPGITFHFPVTAVAAIALAAVVLGVLAAILPARRAARLKPVEALSYE
jgi:putative ABC transport system permease protein